MDLCTLHAHAHMYMNQLSHTQIHMHTKHANTRTNSTDPSSTHFLFLSKPLPLTPSLQDRAHNQVFQHWGTTQGNLSAGSLTQCWSLGPTCSTPCLALALGCPNSYLGANPDAKVNGRSTTSSALEPNSTHQQLQRNLSFTLCPSFYLKSPCAEPGIKQTSPPWLH